MAYDYLLLGMFLGSTLTLLLTWRRNERSTKRERKLNEASTKIQHAERARNTRVATEDENK